MSPESCNCVMCGRFIGYWESVEFASSRPPSNAIKAKGFPFPKYVCSLGCKDEWKAREAAKKSSGSEQSTSDPYKDVNGK